MAHTAGTSGTSDASGRGGTDGGGTKERTHRAGAFDMRNFIAALIGLYGIVLTIYGIIGSSAKQLKKSDDVNINLWAGIGMIVVAAVFLIWARLRPVVVPDTVDTEAESPSGH
jgi:hypothetical protein